MAKTQERLLAKKYYVELGYTAKDIALKLGVSEQSMTKWVNDPSDNWTDLRAAYISKTEIRTDNIRQVINSLCDERLELAHQLKLVEQLVSSNPENAKAVATIRKDLARIDDSISKWNKTLTSLDKDNKVSLSVYLLVMDEIFTALSKRDEKTYLKTIDFQEEHLSEVASRYR